MRAASYDHYGPAAEVLEVRDVQRPAPGPGEVLVKVALSGVNPTDWKSRSGATPRPIDGFQVPHHDGAGVIEAVGDGVDPAGPASGSGCGSPRPGAGGAPRRSGPSCRPNRPCRCPKAPPWNLAPAWAFPP